MSRRGKGLVYVAAKAGEVRDDGFRRRDLQWNAAHVNRDRREVAAEVGGGFVEGEAVRGKSGPGSFLPEERRRGLGEDLIAAAFVTAISAASGRRTRRSELSTRHVWVGSVVEHPFRNGQVETIVTKGKPTDVSAHEQLG
jgi:hypothetical protein